MNYKKLKENVFLAKIKIEKMSEMNLKRNKIDKKTVEKDLIQYLIFFEELENKIKLEPKIKINDYKKNILHIERYMQVLNKMLLF